MYKIEEHFKKDSVIVALDQYHNRFNLYETASSLIDHYRETIAGIKLESAFFEYGRSIVYDIKEALVKHPYNKKLLMLDLKLNSIPETNNKIFKMYEEVADLITVRSKSLEGFNKAVDMSKLCWVPFLSSEYDINAVDIRMIVNQVLVFNPGYVVLSPYILNRCDMKFLLKETKILTPGIRFDLGRNQKDGHSETLTPNEAYSKGVDYLIMGRSFYTWG